MFVGAVQEKSTEVSVLPTNKRFDGAFGNVDIVIVVVFEGTEVPTLFTAFTLKLYCASGVNPFTTLLVEEVILSL